VTKLKKDVIELIKNNLRKCKWTRSSTGRLLQNFSDLMEAENLSEGYETLKFYCDWSCHSIFDRNKYLFTLLNDININLNDLEIPDSGASTIFSDMSVIVDALKFGALMEEMIKLMNHSKIPLEVLAMRRNRMKFLQAILKLLCSRKILYPIDPSGPATAKTAETKEPTKVTSKRIDEVNKMIKLALDSGKTYSIDWFVESIVFCNVEGTNVNVELEIIAGKKRIQSKGAIVITD